MPQNPGQALGLDRDQLLALVNSLHSIFDMVGAQEAAAAWTQF